MKIQDKTKEELIIELKELQEAYDSLKGSTKTDLPGCEHTEALLNIRKMLKSIEQAAKIGGWEFDVDTMRQTWTEETFHILEIDTSHGTPDVPEGIGFIAPEYQPMALLGIQRAIEFGEPYNQEWEIITAKGNKRWVAAIATPYLENGKTKSVSGSFQDITQRKLTEIALVRSEENLSTTLHSIGDAVISTDKNGLVVGMNPVAERLCGWKLTEASGKPLAEVFTIINAETRQAVADPVKKVLEKGEIVGLANHTILVSKNGSEYQIADSAAPIKNKEGAITGIVLVFSDITGSYLAQKQIKESEERYRSLLNSLEAGIVVHASDTSVVMNNARAAELLGLSNDQMKGKAAIDPAWKFTHEDNTPLTLDEYPVNRIVNGRQAIKNQILGIHQPGKNDVVWVTVNGFPVLDANGGITEVVISFIDITGRKQVEKSLKESEERFKNMFERHSSIMLLIEPESGMIIGANEASARFYGYSKDELLTMRIDDINMLYPEQVKTERDDAVHEKRSFFLFPHRLANGEVRTVEVHSSPIIFQDQKILFSIIHDVTERKKLEKIREIQFDIATSVVTADSVEQLLEFLRTRLSQLFDTKNFFAALYNPESNTLKKLHWVDEADDFEEWDAAKSFSGYVVQSGKTLLLNRQEITKLGAEQNIPITGTPAECWLGVPLVVDKKNIGVLVIQSYTDPRAYDASSAMLFEQIALDLSVFIEKTTILQHLNFAKKQAEESEAKFRTLSENSPAIIYRILLQPTPVFDYISPIVTQITGYTPEEYYADFDLSYKMVHPEDMIILANSKQKTKGEPFVLRLIRKDGKTIWVEQRQVLQNDKAGNPFAIEGISTDITAQKEADATLAFQGNMLSQVSEAVIATDLEGAITFWNNSAEKLYGWKPEEVLGKNIIDITPSTASKEQAIEIFNSLAKGQNWMGEFMVKNREGHSFPVTVNDSPMFDSNHNLIGIIGISFDITERKKIENEIRLLNETLEQRVADRTNELFIINKELEFHLSELEQFSYVSNHDLQEPLRTLIQFTQLFNEKYAGKLDEEGNKYVDFISKSALRMKVLVKDLLEYTLLGKESVKTIVDCNMIVETVLHDLDESIKRSNARITVQKLPVFTGYETEMRQLFQNLIGNAIKYQQQDNCPEIHISAESHDKEWLFSIKDNGIGIDQKHFEKIFIIFQRLHNRNEYDGTGIGLANCRKVVGLHGGKIWVVSTPEEGSTFMFTIPKQ